MHEYHVGFPHGMMLAVEIDNTPIKMHITFPSGKKLTFDYVGGPTRTATVTTSSGPVPSPIPATWPRKPAAAMAAHGPLTRKIEHEPIAGAGPGALSTLDVAYIDPGGSEM